MARVTEAERSRRDTSTATKKSEQKKRDDYLKQQAAEKEATKQATERLPDIYQKSWKPQIKRASADRQRETKISITDYGAGQNLDLFSKALAKVGADFLRFEGYKVECKSEYSPRFGSDDDYGNRTYVWLDVSW